MSKSSLRHSAGPASIGESLPATPYLKIFGDSDEPQGYFFCSESFFFAPCLGFRLGEMPRMPLSLERRYSSRTFRYGYLVTT